MQHHKGLLIVLDGLGDRPIPALDNQTPLERAYTPNMDRLLASGMCGLADPLSPGVPVGTHTGTGLLFGLPVRAAIDLSRGPVEAAGIGLISQPGDVLLRCNFATLERRADGFDILDRRAGRIQSGGGELAKALDLMTLGNGITATFRQATHHRAVLKLSGRALSSRITDTDTASRYKSLGLRPCKARDPRDDRAVATAAAVNLFTERAFGILKDHPVNIERARQGKLPANGIICRSAGTRLEMPSLVNHLGLKAAVVAGEGTILGMAKLLGYEAMTHERFTSLPDTDIDMKIDRAIKALQNNDLVFLHLKGTDICSHDCDPAGKTQLIERFDKAMAPILDLDAVIGISGDHSTDCNTGRHTGDPVPSLISSAYGRVDRVEHFGERYCVGGGLGRITASNFLATLLDQMNFPQNFKSNEGGFYF